VTSGRPGPASPGPGAGRGPRVSTLELFFDLVFAFTLTQLTARLADGAFSVAAIGQVLLVFGVLWWMYGGYAWLTNARAPDSTGTRLLLLLGMAGFLVVGLAIPRGFTAPRAGGSGLALGLGYLLVVAVHSMLYFQVNRNIARIIPFNVGSAVLVIVAGTVGGTAKYPLWAAALAIEILGPLIRPLAGRFEVSPAHFVERHGALIIVALGESVAAVGIGAASLALTVQLVTAVVLGLAVSACLWWAYFGGGDDERAEQAMTRAPRERRPRMALAGYFYTHVPMLLGVVTLAAGVKVTIGHAAQPHPARQALALGVGVALFLAGDAAFREVMGIGRAWVRYAAAVFAVATAALGAAVAVEAQLAVLTAGLVGMLLAEGRLGDAAHSPAAVGEDRACD
jgi:low temperature requirement protein LtrA